ncbi:MAG: hypothetical protein RLZZ522_1227 [Verrucomicrobiota bacterium]
MRMVKATSTLNPNLRNLCNLWLKNHRARTLTSV